MGNVASFSAAFLLCPVNTIKKWDTFVVVLRPKITVLL